MNSNVETHNRVFVLISEGKIDELKRLMEEKGITIDRLNKDNIAVFFNASISGVQTIAELLDMGLEPNFDFYYNYLLEMIESPAYSNFNSVKASSLRTIKLILFLMTVPGINVPRVNAQMREYLNNHELDLVPILSEIRSVVRLNSKRASPLIAFLGQALGPEKLLEIINKSAFVRRRNLLHHYNTYEETKKNMRNRWMRLANEQTRRGGRRQRRRTRR